MAELLVFVVAEDVIILSQQPRPTAQTTAEHVEQSEAHEEAPKEAHIGAHEEDRVGAHEEDRVGAHKEDHVGAHKEAEAVPQDSTTSDPPRQ